MTPDEGEKAVDTYISSCPPEARSRLESIREQIRAALPGASEGISYGIPTFYMDGRYLVYVAAWKRHISLHPVPSGDAALDRDVAPYRAGRGTLRFPIEDSVPDGLVARIVQALLEQREHGAPDQESGGRSGATIEPIT